VGYFLLGSGLESRVLIILGIIIVRHPNPSLKSKGAAINMRAEIEATAHSDNISNAICREGRKRVP